MRKGKKKMKIKESELLNMVLANPREHRKVLIYLSVSGLCAGLVVLFQFVR